MFLNCDFYLGTDFFVDLIFYFYAVGLEDGVAYVGFICCI